MNLYRNPSRYRDYHSERKILGTAYLSYNNSIKNGNSDESKRELNRSNVNYNSHSDSHSLHLHRKDAHNSAKTVSVTLENVGDVNPKPVKKITPMHLKLYESTMHDVRYNMDIYNIFT